MESGWKFNDLSTDAVPIGGDKQQQASLCRFDCLWVA